MGIFNFDVAHGYNKIFGVIRAKTKEEAINNAKIELQEI